METEGIESTWSSLNQDILERVGRGLSLRALLAARQACRHWRQHVSAAVTRVPHDHQPHQTHLLELDAQPSGHDEVWHSTLGYLATCLPHLSEIMVYVSSRVAAEDLGRQLRSLPHSLPGLTKLELRYIVPSSVPCLGTSLQQLQPSLTALTGLSTLYLIMGASPEPGEVASVLPALPGVRDLKLLSGLPQYAFTNSKLEALGCATQLHRLHLEVSGVGQVDAGLAALSRLGRLRQLLLDGLVTLGPAVIAALQSLPELQELKLELDSPQHIADLFRLPGLTQLSLTYHGDELDDADDPAPPDAAGGGGAVAAAAGSHSNTDSDALNRLVRGNAVRPVVRELGLVCCSFPTDPLPRIAQLTSLTSLTFYDCRWTAAPPGPPPALAVADVQRAAAAACASGGHGPMAGAIQMGPAALRELMSALDVTTRGGDPANLNALLLMGPAGWGGGVWSVLTTLTGLQSFGLAQCVVPPISHVNLAALAAAWPGITSLQLQSALHPLLLHLPPPARFAAFLSRWSRLESLTLSGSWCNDPRVALDVSLLPASLTSLVISSVTLLCSPAERAALAGALDRTCNNHCRPEPATPQGSESDGGNGRSSQAQPCSSSLSPHVKIEGRCGGAQSAGTGAIASGSTAPDHLASTLASARSAVGTDANHHLRPGFTAVATPAGALPAPDANTCYNGCTCAASRLHAANAPFLPALEHLVMGEVRLGPGLSLQSLVDWAPNLRSLEINNLVPNLTDDTCTALAALTALTVLRVSQDQEPDGQTALKHHGGTHGGADGGHSEGMLSGMGLTSLTGLRNLRQLEWLPWGCEPLGLVHVRALAHLRKLHLVTLRGARDGAISEVALEDLRDRLPLCDIDDTEWSGLVDV